MQTPDQLADTAALVFGVQRADLFGHSRVARVAQARHALAWALRQNDWSLEAIGEYLGRDHTTIIYALARIEQQATCDPRLAGRLAALDVAEPIDWQAIARAQAEEIERLRRQLEGRHSNGA